MKTNLPQSWQRRSPVSGRRRFTFLLALLLVVSAMSGRPRHEGDVLEYATMATAIASHGTPDIRPDDVERGRLLAPGLDALFDDLLVGIRDEQRQLPKPGFARTADDEVYAIHFFAYSALVAAALTVFGAAGLPAAHVFVAVNLVAVTILGASLHRLLGSAWRASAAILLFFACGGILYWNWSSPEIASAAALLAALALFCTGAPIAAGLLAGLAASQNPPIVFFAAFAPAFLALLNYSAGESPRTSVTALNVARNYAGAALCVALAAAPFVFNFYQFGIPSWITKMSTRADLIGWPRLASFFLDPNQGMIVAVPVLTIALAACGWRGATAVHRRVHALLIALVATFTLALALPALSAINWNSGARGVMRYGFWASMPLLFAFLLYLRSRTIFPRALVVLVLMLQALFMAHAKSYRSIEFSPAAHWMLQHAPEWYNPDPEIFYERLTNGETFLDPALAYSYAIDGKVMKTLYNEVRGVRHLCGPGRLLANVSVDAGYDGWRYFNGAPHCAGVTTFHGPAARKGDTERKKEKPV